MDCCTVLSGKFSCRFCCCDVFRCFVSCFLTPCSTPWLWVPSAGYWHCFDTLSYIVFVHRVVTTVRALGLPNLHGAIYIMQYCSIELVTCNLHYASYIIQYGRMWLEIRTVQFTLYGIAVWNEWLAICNAQVTLYSFAAQNWWLANCTVQLRYVLLNYELATCSLYYTSYIIQIAVQNWWLEICTAQVTLYVNAVWDLCLVFCTVEIMLLSIAFTQCKLFERNYKITLSFYARIQTFLPFLWYGDEK